MQISGTFAGLSDGVKKTIVGAPAPARRAPAAPVVSQKRDIARPAASSHRAGGHARQQKDKK